MDRATNDLFEIYYNIQLVIQKKAEKSEKN